MKLLRKLFSLVVTLVLLSQSAEWAIAQDAEDFVVITGSVAYKQRIAMPPDAVLSVRVEDVSRADAAAIVLVESNELFGNRQVPLDFVLKVPRAAIDARFSYAVRATVSVDGESRFITTRSYPVLTRGASNQVNLLLDAAQPAVSREKAAGKPAVPAAGLTETYWKLTELDGKPVRLAAEQKREVRITLAGEGLRLTAFGGCNQHTGSYHQDGSALRLTLKASTMMACVPQVMDFEDHFLKIIGAVTEYQIEGQQLQLIGGGQVLARFEAVYL